MPRSRSTVVHASSVARGGTLDPVMVEKAREHKVTKPLRKTKDVKVSKTNRPAPIKAKRRAKKEDDNGHSHP